jgi:hypothetical protein
MVGAAGFVGALLASSSAEPATEGSTVLSSAKLSYAPIRLLSYFVLLKGLLYYHQIIFSIRDVALDLSLIIVERTSTARNFCVPPFPNQMSPSPVGTTQRLVKISSIIIETPFLLWIWFLPPVFLTGYHFRLQRVLPQYLPRQGHYHSSQICRQSLEGPIGQSDQPRTPWSVIHGSFFGVKTSVAGSSLYSQSPPTFLVLSQNAMNP